MKNRQGDKPKYYIFHNKTSNDLFIATASKCFNKADEKTKQLYPNEHEEYELGGSNYTISQFEIDILDND